MARQGPKKGTVNNPKGRPAGSQNIITREIKENFKEFVDKNFHKVQGWLDRVAQTEPDKALNLYLQFSERILGKVSTSSLDITSDGKQLTPPTIIVNGSPPDSI